MIPALQKISKSNVLTDYLSVLSSRDSQLALSKISVEAALVFEKPFLESDFLIVNFLVTGVLTC